MDWLNTAQQVLTLISGLIGLISAAIGVFFAIRATIQKNKNKSANEIWNLVMQMANEAMRAAEKSGASGEDKKTMVVKAVNAAAEAAGQPRRCLLVHAEHYLGWAGMGGLGVC